MGFADSLFPGGSQIEIQDHINNLWAHYNKMRDGLQCGTGEEAQPGSGDATCYPYYYTTEYCIDVYSGTYASQRLGPSQCPMYYPTSAEIASIPSVDAQLKRQVFDTLPLRQMAHLVSILNLYLNPHQHGFLIEADGGQEPLYLNAWGGASEGDVVRLHRDCMTSNTDCTWRYENGMLASDTDPTLKLQASSAQGPLILTRSCTSSTASCLWTYDHGQWKNNNGGLMQTLDGVAHSTRVGLNVLASLAGTVSQTWTMPNVMFNPTQFGTSSAMRAWGQSLGSAPWGTGDAADQGPVADYTTYNAASSACLPNNPDCTWTITNYGMILSDKNPLLGLNAWGGGTIDNPPLVVTSACASYNPDCTWKISSTGISVDNGGKQITYQAVGGTSNERLSLQAPCTGPYCFYNSTTFSIVQAAD